MQELSINLSHRLSCAGCLVELAPLLLAAAVVVGVIVAVAVRPAELADVGAVLDGAGVVLLPVAEESGCGSITSLGEAVVASSPVAVARGCGSMVG